MDTEKLSCTYSLSDMELFIFPDLMYSLVLANIMSPIIWKWKDDPWFDKINTFSPYKKILRIKQYIMNNFTFNLDLDTWGLTTKEKELKRFEKYVDLDILKNSNALFGYEGDKYYFDIDIRKHFGLDKYTDNIIPFWKTETIEAMDAFKYKAGYTSGAGECVSLSALYVAALFIVGKIPLQDMYIIGTPLHSQNLINIKQGILTNNRRIVSKNMWFNGTEISAKARRALENEKITYVSHISGYIHTMYKEASINENEYNKFHHFLSNFLKTNLTVEILCNFLRHSKKFQPCFQVQHNFHGKIKYIELEKLFRYEHSSKLKVSDNTRHKLLEEIDEEEFYASPIPNRVNIINVEIFLNKNSRSLDNKKDRERLETFFVCNCLKSKNIITELTKFTVTKPKVPAGHKQFIHNNTLKINPDMTRKNIISYITSQADSNKNARLALYCYRDLKIIPWEPFVKAALERNPVCTEDTKNFETQEIYNNIISFNNNSIYDTTRLAQPDEVWNFKRGDGVEKALLFASILKKRNKKNTVKISINKKNVYVSCDKKKYEFVSHKGLIKELAL